MIDFKFKIVSSTCVAATILLFTQYRYVIDGIVTAILSFARSSVRGVDSVIGSPPFSIGFSPRFVSGAFAFRIKKSPSLGCSAMPMGVLRSPLSSGSSFVSGTGSIPSFAPINRTLNADSIRDETLVMPVLAWCAGRVVAFTRALGCDPRRMPWLFLLAGERVLDRARGANSGDCVSLRKVPVSARLSGIVETLACNLRGFALWHFVQGSPPPASNIFIVARAA
jgi:hypothetical protein